MELIMKKIEETDRIHTHYDIDRDVTILVTFYKEVWECEETGARFIAEWDNYWRDKMVIILPVGTWRVLDLGHGGFTTCEEPYWRVWRDNVVYGTGW